MTTLGTFIVLVAAFVVLVSWFGIIAEFIGLARFSWSVFGIGPVVVRGRYRLAQVDQLMKRLPTRTVATSKVHRHDDRTLLLRPKLMSAFPPTPFPIKSTLTFTGDDVYLEGRAPLFSVIFFTTWMIGWVVAGGLVLRVGDRLSVLLVMLVALVGSALLAILSLAVETRRTRRAIDVLKFVQRR